MSADLYILQKRDTNYLLAMYDEIIHALKAEGVDLQGEFDLTEDQIGRITGKLTRKPETALKKVEKAMTGATFSIMHAELRSMLREDYLKQYPQTTPEDVKKRGFHLNGKDYMTYREWFYTRSDSRSNSYFAGALSTAMKNPGKEITQKDIPKARHRPVSFLYPIIPETPVYKMLEAAPATFDEFPDTLQQIRENLGLEEYSYIGIYLESHLPFLHDILKAFVERKPAEIRADELPSIGTPDRTIMPNNALINKMQESEIISEEAFNLPVGTTQDRKKQKLFAYVIIEEITGSDALGRPICLSEYERQITNAICSLWVYAKKLSSEPLFSIDQIAHAMPGASSKATTKQRQSIVEAIERLRRYHIYINATDEMRSRGIIGDTEEFILDDFFITATKITVVSKNGHKKAEAYRFRQPPLVFEYSEKTNQILSVKPDLLNIKKLTKNPITGELSPSTAINMNAKRQAITGYIVRRIEIMKHDHKKAQGKLIAYETKRANKMKDGIILEEKTIADYRKQEPVILFDTLFSAVGLYERDEQGRQLPLDKDAAKEYRNFCFQVLDYQKAMGNIVGYSRKTVKRQIEGVNISL